MISLKVCMCLSVENTRLGLRLSVRLFHCTDVVIFSAQNHSSTMAVKDEDYIIEQLLGLSSSKSSLSTSTSASNAMLSSTSAPNLKLKSGLDDSTRTQETTTCSVCLRRKQNVLNGWTNSDQVNREMKGYIANPYFNGAVGYRSSCNCVQAQNAKKAGITGNSVKGNVSIRLKQLKNRRNVINSLDEPRQKSFRHFDDPKRYIEEYRASKLKSLHIDTQHLVCTHKVDDSLLKSLTSLTNLLDGFSVTKPVIKVADSFEINESQTSRKLIGHSQELSINKSEDDLYKKRNSEPSKLSVMPFSKNVMRKEPEKQLR